MTLTELLIVFAIVAILGMIAYPNYSGYQQRAARVDAKNALEQIATIQERFYTTNLTYTSDLTNLGFASDVTDSGFYVVSVPTANRLGFQAIAVPAPASRQIDDADCQQFSIDSNGLRVAIPDPDGKCW